MRISKLIQQEYFQAEISLLKKKKSLQTLSPFVGSAGAFRDGSRFQSAAISFDQKHPILLQPKINFVDLLVRHEHLRLHNAGPQSGLASIRLRYWPLNGVTGGEYNPQWRKMS